MKRSILILLVIVCMYSLFSVTSSVAVDSDPTPEFQKAEPLGPVIAARAGSDNTLDLRTCVAEALKSNDLLTAEYLRMDELHGQMDQALSTGLPTLDIVGSWRRSRDPSFALDSTFGGGDSSDGLDDLGIDFSSFMPAPGEIPAQSFMTTNLNLAWTINPLKISGAIGAAKLGIKRQELSTEAVTHQIAQNVITSYFGIIKVAEEIQAIRAQMVNQQELLDIMKMRYELGMATRLDTLQATVTLANVFPQLKEAEARLRNEGSRLNALMGRNAQTPLSIANEDLIEDVAVNSEVALELAWKRPDIEASELFTDILRRNRKVQIAENRPYLTINGSYGYMGKTFDSVFDEGHSSWSTNVALNIPVFDGLLTRGLVHETEAQIRRNEAEITGQRREVQVEVMELLANLELARGVLEAALINLDRSEYVLEESLMMLQMGKINYVDVLVSESNRAEARRNVIDARYSVLATTASLKRAIGRSPLTPLQNIPGLVMEVSK